MYDKFYIIIPEGENKGKRLYFENLVGTDYCFPIEMYHLYLNAIKNNLKVFFIECLPIHNINLTKKELNFFNSKILVDDWFYKNIKFSKKASKIKNLQYKDICKIYDLAVKYKNIKLIYTHPLLINNQYCFSIMLVVEPTFDLNLFLKTEFFIFKINSIIELFENTLSLEKMKVLYNFLESPFKENMTSFKKSQKPWKLIEKCKERLELNKILKKQEKLLNNFINHDFASEIDRKKYNDLEKKCEVLRKILEKNKIKLWDIEMYKKIQFSHLCYQFIIFDELILKDTIFFTNFIQLVGGVSVIPNENENIFDFNYLQHTSLLDILYNDMYCMFTCTNTVYDWIKI